MLASASPARLSLLRSCGVEPVVRPAQVDERAIEDAERRRDPLLDPAGLVTLLARAKGEAVVAGLAETGQDSDEGPPDLVLGCDSVLEFDGEIHGKPGVPEVARERWRRISGRRAVLWTGHWLRDLPSGREVIGAVPATVHFADIPESVIDGYVEGGEPLQVAGGFTIDGRGGPLIESIEGHPSTVIGLCLPWLRRAAAELAVPWWELAEAQDVDPPSPSFGQ